MINILRTPDDSKIYCEGENADAVLNTVQQNSAEPLDWTYNNTPSVWNIDGQKTEFDFTEDVYPALLDHNTQPY